MKDLLKARFIALSLTTWFYLFSSCGKVVTGPSNPHKGGGTPPPVTFTLFAKPDALLLSEMPGDAIYAINAGLPGDKTETVSFNDLPGAVTANLNAKYSGYTFTRAYAIFNPDKAVQGYVVSAVSDGNPAGLKFDTAGNFVSVLAQRHLQRLKEEAGE